MKRLKIVVALMVCALASSCALKPISSEYAFIKTDLKNVGPEQLGNGSVLIYNGANLLHMADNTARLNIWLDEKPMGQIRPGEYVIINMKNGTHHFKLLHIDMVNMRSEHDVEVTEDTRIIMAKPTITSNKLEVTNILPSNFDKFEYAEKR